MRLPPPGRHDDYDYAVVNQLLDRRLKSFVKTMCVYPERLSAGAERLKGVMQGFQRSEKVRWQGWMHRDVLRALAGLVGV